VRDLDALLVQLVRDLPLPELTAVNHG
jgi:hypothetical protein